MTLWGLDLNVEPYQAKHPLNPNLLFAGQWFDEESGLAYNRFRYYAPETANYLCPDPIGLNGGETPYGYVSNPWDWVDPFGLAGCDVLSKIGKDGAVIQSAATKKGIQKVDRIFNNKNEAQNWASKQLGPSKERLYDNNGKWIGWQNKAGDQVYWGHGDWGKGQGSSTFPYLNYNINGTKGHLFLKDKITNRNQLGEFIEYFKLQ